MPSRCPRILLVDDMPEARELTRTMLDFEGYAIDEAGDGLEAIQKLVADTYCLVVTDYHMPRMDGLQLLQYVRRHWPTLPVIVLTGERIGELVAREGGYAWIPKPHPVNEFIRTVRRAVAGARPVQTAPAPSRPRRS
jgi:CheY-like chemotaxis protein